MILISKRVWAAVLIVAVGPALVGCSSNGTGTAASSSPSSSSYSPSSPATLTNSPTGKPTTVSAAPATTAPAVGLSEVAALPGQMHLRVVKTASGTVSGQGIGVVSGQAEAIFTLEFTNDSDKSFNLDTVEVNAWYGANKTPAVPSASGTKPFEGSLPAGQSKTATYAFAIPTAERADVGLAVWYQQGKPTVVFQGKIG